MEISFFCPPRPVGQGRDERRQRRPHVRDVVARGAAVVDENRDLHRVQCRFDAEDFARDVVFADDEVGGAEVRHPHAGVVDDADVHGLLLGLGGQAARPRQAEGRDDESAEQKPRCSHFLSIGQKGFEFCKLRGI
jgi:hypothetical protein